ncbi:DUF6011 domain-containing protein [Streptomyces spiralis]|uniref:DUF6011 domain-containing protein n=1 Tax=Streptomyces spiralis TaxID=66376 RepID=UPI0036976C2F
MTESSSEEEPVACACGRLLTDPESRARGLGPVCWRKLHRRTNRQPRLATPRAARPGADQPELPADDQLTIWEP